MEGMEPGYVFLPTDEQLINDYLMKKEKGLPLPGKAVVERELYSEKSPWEVLKVEEENQLPWQIFKTRDSKTRKLKYESTIYVLTPLKKASQNRIRRTAGCGKWQEHWTREILDDNDDVIGIKKMLVFMVIDDSIFSGDEECLIKGHWIMYEYTLNESFPFALCKITRHDSKNLKRAPSNIRKRKAAVDKEEVNNWQKNRKQARAIDEEDEHNQQDHHEANPTAIVPAPLPFQLPPMEGVEQSTSASILPLQSIPAMQPPTSSDTIDQFCNSGIEFDIFQFMDPKFDFTMNGILQPLEQQNSSGVDSYGTERKI